MLESDSPSRTRQSWRRRHRRRVVRTSDIESGAAWAQQGLCDALCDEGYVILQLPDSSSAAKFLHCVAVMRQFFARDRAEKNFCAASDGPGQHVGYMCADVSKAEMFEAKKHHDPRWPWPNARLRNAVLDARQLLDDVAVLCLRALAAPLGLSADALLRLLDAPVDTEARDADPAHYFGARSTTTMRVWNYWPGGVGNEAHTDNTLLTVTPAGTRVGLGVRCVADGVVRWPEAHMREDEVLVFAGDALGFLTSGRVRPLLHWVTPPPPLGASRISLPFFLRPRLDALLDPAAASSGEDKEPLLSAQSSALCGAITQAALERNERNVRWTWPWKRLSYYECAGGARDEGGAGASSSTAPHASAS